MSVVVVGGGLIGLASAWRAAERGLDVTVVDDAPGSGASGVAAGMLAPVTEVTYGEEELLRLGIASAQRWAGFASDLAEAAERPVAYRSDGTLLVAHDDDDRRALDDLAGFMADLDLDVERLRSRQCRQREPLLHPRIRGGVLAHGDHSVDPRQVLAALEVAADRAGVTLRRDRVAAVEHHDGRVTGVRLEDAEVVPASQVVLAAGVWSGRIDGLPAEVVPPVRPVKGQVLRLRSPDEHLRLGGAVRGLVRGRSVYLVPREDGEVVVGATQEERGFDTEVTAGGVRELLDDAVRLVPGIDEFALVDAVAGLRPGTPDNRPLLGRTALDGLVLATGHFRNGVLLTPVTAEVVADVLVGAVPDPVAEVADPARLLGPSATPSDAGGAAATSGAVSGAVGRADLHTAASSGTVAHEEDT